MAFESEELFIVASDTWLQQACYAVFLTTGYVACIKQIKSKNISSCRKAGLNTTD